MSVHRWHFISSFQSSCSTISFWIRSNEKQTKLWSNLSVYHKDYCGLRNWSLILTSMVNLSIQQAGIIPWSHETWKKEGWQIVNDLLRHLICTKWLMQQCMQHKGIIKYIKISHQWLLSFKYIEVTFSMKFWHLKVKLNMQRHQELKWTNTPWKKPALNWFVW